MLGAWLKLVVYIRLANIYVKIVPLVHFDLIMRKSLPHILYAIVFAVKFGKSSVYDIFYKDR